MPRACRSVLRVAFTLLAAASAGAQPTTRPVPAAPRAAPDVVLPAAGDPLAGFDAYIEQARRDWGVPGLAVAVVRNDSTVLLRGYGVRTLGTTDSVDAHTLFANASTTKAFTAMAAALLVDEGRLHWDDHPADRLPGFALRDPWVTRELTLRDLLRHTLGFPDPGHLWYARDDSMPALLPRLRRVPAQTSFRAHFAYNNVGYAVAGAVVARAAGTSWDAVVRERLLAPLGMTETRTRGAELPAAAGHRAANVATPHDLVSDTLRPLPAWTQRLVDGVSPAGSMYSSAADMARWLRFLLAGGRLPPPTPGDTSGRRLVSDAALAELFAPQSLVGAEEFYPTARLTRPNFTAYGLGWFLQDYRGEKVAFHTGSIDGTVALVGLLPARHLGIVVFANRDHAEVRHALMLRAFDASLDAPGTRPRDWNAELRVLYDGIERERRLARGRADSLRARDPRPPRPAPDYAGHYADSLYGPAHVRALGGRLTLELSAHLVADLLPRGGDAFTARWRAGWMAPDAVVFVPGADGRVRTLELGDGPASYARLPVPPSPGRQRASQ